MSRNEDFFASKKAAAVFKHGIISRYSVVFAAKAGQRVTDQQVVFLDGYAGRGEYEDGSPGSPLLFMRSAARVDSFRNVRAVFVERDDANFAHLRAIVTRATAGPVAPMLHHQSLDECLPGILRDAKDAALFAFLDPFGPALAFDLVKSSLLARPRWPPTEVLLHFSVSAVARMAGAMHRARMTGQPLSAADRKSIDHLNRFLGGDWWQDHFASVMDESEDARATEAALRVADRYRAMLTEGTDFISVSMPVRPRPDLMPKYVLVLFTRHPEGTWAFADALGKAGLEWYGAWMNERMASGAVSYAPSLFDDDPDLLFDPARHEHESKARWIATIAQNIRGLLDDGPFRIADRMTDVYGTTLGTAWIPHVRAAVKDLYRDGAIVNDGKGDKFHYDVIRPATKPEAAA